MPYILTAQCDTCPAKLSMNVVDEYLREMILAARDWYVHKGVLACPACRTAMMAQSIMNRKEALSRET